MMDPYRIEGPALISFSFGRTSAFMLHEIVRAHGGKLPDDVKVAFSNTGKEREETLRFGHECGSRWGVHVHWLEWRDTKPCFEEVGYNSAARNGEPFAAPAEEREHVRRLELQEIADGALGDDPRTRGAARDALCSQPALAAERDAAADEYRL